LENNQGGLKRVQINDWVTNGGDGNNFNIGASADTTNNQGGSKIVTLGRGLASKGNGNTFNVGLLDLAASFESN
jgi:hypothetical protein